MIAEHLLFRSDGGFIRIPIWGHIPLSGPLKKIISHPSFLRLKGIRQLSFSQQVYPGATHTRFEHSIGVYHLMKLILQRMLTNPLALSLQGGEFHFDDHNCRLLLAASLLHDIGHYPHAHIIEDQIPVVDGERVFSHHEDLCERFIHEEHPGMPTIADILRLDWKVSPEAVITLIKDGSGSRFGKLISGTLDPDKMDYLMRDAHHCNIPYGSIDIERLIESFVPDPERERFAITEKGIAPLESLMFAKYMMMRNVYWHHTSRSLSAMLRRLLQDIATEGLVAPQALRELFYGNADDRVLFELRELLGDRTHPLQELLQDIIMRRVYKRAITVQPYLEESGEADDRWFAYNNDSTVRRQMEQEICRFLNARHNLSLAGHEVLIDPPSKKDIFDYADLRELRVYPTRSEHVHYSLELEGKYIRFDDLNESVFSSGFILAFERYTKKFRLLCRPDLTGYIVAAREEIMAMMPR
ncbi:HD domain-containing protein [Pelodictyon luteolum]|uniref:Metal dependent phosphohydrolase n=1 Tax=Chlorobium luteolum (strain DSM 273 / BCRC 81028 / 2530) TaxID=319225 RepID=Q3B656_CHLL3|nr:HD domain-containing protein [Pelodictyon luteolum]ABB23175.1 metal dependent phosphohydrolase [Pelodictyon luteolum DSM 273]